MRAFAKVILVGALLAACGSEEPTSSNFVANQGERNDAYRVAADRHGVPVDWLVAIGYQQGRFEAAEQQDVTDDPTMQQTMDPGDPAPSLDVDTPVDEVEAAPDDSMDSPDNYEPLQSWGVMFLTDAQITRAASLTGRSEDDIRTNTTANIDGAAALLEADMKTTDLRSATTQFLAVTDEGAQLALDDLDHVIEHGFAVTTSDGEELALVGTKPDTGVDEAQADAGSILEVDPTQTAAAVAPGHYPHVQWIASPNHSSRQGSPIRYIVIHDIEGTMAGAISVFKHSSSQASSHYIVRSSDGHIVKMVLESQNAWHAGHGWFNRHSVGIEHEGFAFRKHGGGFYTKRLYAASAKLSCAIAHRNHIPVDRKHIFGHFNVPSNLSSHTLCSDKRGIAGKCGGVSHHADPGRYWDWKQYMHLVATCVQAAK
jgi:N-acetyl-anhydromuramyl-L-alanine amidase AmpD